MNSPELVYIGIKGSVVALNRATGEQVWATHLKGSDFVNVVLHPDSNQIYATTYGEIFCLNARTGDGLWQNGLKGYGMGLATLAVADATAEGPPVILAEKRRRDEAARAASAAGTTA